MVVESKLYLKNIIKINLKIFLTENIENIFHKKYFYEKYFLNISYIWKKKESKYQSNF